MAAAGSLLNRPVRAVLAPMAPIGVPVDARVCRDLDTP